MNKLIAICMCMCMCLFLASCCPKKVEVEKVVKEKQYISRTYIDSFGYDSLTTVKHDDHLFIVWESSGKGTMINHPDCPACSSRPMHSIIGSSGNIMGGGFNSEIRSVNNEKHN